MLQCFTLKELRAVTVGPYVLGFTGSTMSVATPQLWCYSVKADIDIA